MADNGRMETAPRIYDRILADHLARHRQMAFVSGPRQVGKTTTCRAHADAYLNWDNLDDRKLILAGPTALAEHLGASRLRERLPVGVLDELHKYPRWKQLLKGFFDTHADEVRTIVTGSGRMDVFRRGGDSLMGRYFLYRMHPFSIGEVVRRELPDPVTIVHPPAPIPDEERDALWRHGGYPEPFLKRDVRFSRQWQGLRREQIVREDVRDLTRIHQLDQVELLLQILTTRSSDRLIYANLAQDVQVSVDTIRRWVTALRDLHVGFLVRPWFRNVTRSLRKEPKWFLRDWAAVEDDGARAETFVAAHLLKAVQGWTDLGLGRFELCYLRDKEQREVDLLVIRDGKPWFLAEVKFRDESLSPALGYFQELLQAPFAFQVVVDAPFVAAHCFARPRGPMVVPARTLLSQLM